MLSILPLFGKSPFAPLQTHMESVSACVRKLPELFIALEANNSQQLEKICEEISFLEHQADLLKNDIRNHLPKSLLLAVDRSSLLEMLSLQDSLADHAEDIAVLINLYPLKMLEPLKNDLRLFLQKNLDSFEGIYAILKELHELLESSFGGIEAQRVNQMVDQVAKQEHEADLLQRALLRHLFAQEKQLSMSAFYLWLRIFEAIGALSNLSEKLAYRVRTTLELK